MFLSMMEQSQARLHDSAGVIDLPMSGRDIADFLQLSTTATRRGFRELEQESIIAPDLAHRVRIVDRDAFNRLLPDALSEPV
jgi:hypothetical protein